ncbi:MAG: two-component regulator propeller domain-containing protein, partial [Lachnospiraceae bacterium]|nr:two-component regulator propeller domain-containing protein [Lachnospiraceae bacterium]
MVAQDNDIYFKSLIAQQSLSQLTVPSIFQDSRGFLWFGTLDGLNRYDGYNIKVFQSSADRPESISSNHINAITEDSVGYLWIGTDKGLNRYCHASGEFISFFKDKETEYNISNDRVSFVYRDKLGQIWIGTEQGLDCVNQKTLTFTKRTFNHFLYNNRIITIHDDSYGNLWIGTLKGLVKYNIKSSKYFIFRKESHNSNSITSNHIRSVFEDSRKNLWIGTSDGLNLYDPKNDSFRHFGKTIYPDLTLTNNAVRCIIEDKEQNLLIGTNKGLNIFNLNTKTLKKYVPDKIIPGSLNHFFVYSLFVDNAETVWIGTFNGGVNYFNQKYNQFRYFNPANDLVYGGINKILLKNNNLWVATDGGGLLEYDQQYSFKNQYLFEKAPRQFNSANFINSILEIDNSLLLGTETDQLLLFDLHSKKVVETINSVSHSFNNMYKTSGGELLLCVNDTLGLRKLDLKKKKLETVTYLNNANREMLFPFSTC